MQTRLDLTHIPKAVLKPLFDMEARIAGSGLERRLIHLIKMRASQINGCAYCIDMHSKEALAGGESEQRLFALSAWREAPFYSERERAALAWTESMTLVADTRVPDEVYQTVSSRFSELELADLTLAIVAINGWNRIAVGFRLEPGRYQPAKRARSAAER